MFEYSDREKMLLEIKEDQWIETNETNLLNMNFSTLKI